MTAFETTFDQEAEAYDRLRPDYVEELFQDLFEYQPIGPDSRALEIGMGSGKASKPFLDRGCELIGLEPGARLARCSLAKYGRTPSFRLEQTTLQDYVCPEGVFDLVYAATAFHWIPEEYGYRRVHALLPARRRLRALCLPRGFRPRTAGIDRGNPGLLPPLCRLDERAQGV